MSYCPIVKTSTEEPWPEEQHNGDVLQQYAAKYNKNTKTGEQNTTAKMPNKELDKACLNLDKAEHRQRLSRPHNLHHSFCGILIKSVPPSVTFHTVR